jgi:uncharacterized phage protein (TIGR01671 family)
MKREIKFRAWDSKHYVMVSVDRMRILCMYNDHSGHIEDDYEKILDIDSDTPLMQYTGLKDKNGVEIYEGDIIALGDVICPITWDDGGFQMITSANQGKSAAIQDRVKKFKVIGNIYENLELL